MNNHVSSEERSYVAFISYRHLPLDQMVAERVQRNIESFVVPKEFRDAEIYDPRAEKLLADTLCAYHEQQIGCCLPGLSAIQTE